MKITVNQLRRIIKEEISRSLKENSYPKIEGPLRLKELVKSGDTSLLGEWDDILLAFEIANSRVKEEKKKKGSILNTMPETFAMEAVEDKALSQPLSQPAKDLVKSLVIFASSVKPGYVPPTADQIMAAMEAHKSAAAARAAMPRRPEMSAEELWNRDHPHRGWRST